MQELDGQISLLDLGLWPGKTSPERSAEDSRKARTSAIKILIGGSPCTHWSIARTKNRETKPEGLGWELFKNYMIALKKYEPDYFLYENNKSMSAAIRAQITEELGVHPVLINSSLVSAQSRQRLYWVGKRNQDGTYSTVDVDQPEDLGILLRDILESGVCWREKSYTLDANYYKTAGTFNPKKQHSRSRLMVAEQVETTADGKGCVLSIGCGSATPEDCGKRHQRNMVAKPVNITADGKAQCLRTTYYKDGIRNMVGNDVDRKTCVAEPVRIGTIESGTQTEHDSKPFRVYSPDGKAVTLQGEAGGYGAKTGLYAVPTGMARRGRGEGSSYEIRNDQKANAVIVGHQSRSVIEAADGKTYPIYEVKGGQITIKEKQYPIKLADGFYIIRKLTVLECMRLQTVPEDYIFPVSDTQAYKMLGNGWTVDVIAHIMSHFDGISTEPVEVLSMYDGMSCGHIALDKLGVSVTGYYATEIDKYAIKTTQANYPDTVQLGDAFQVRNDGWSLGGVGEGDK